MSSLQRYWELKVECFISFARVGQTQQIFVPFILMPIFMPGEVFMKNAIN